MECELALSVRSVACPQCCILIWTKPSLLAVTTYGCLKKTQHYPQTYIYIYRVTKRTEDSFLHCVFMVVRPRMAGDVQISLKFRKFPVSGGPKYCVYPVSKGQAWTLSCFFFRLPVSRLLSLPNRYLLRCDESCCFA